MTDYNPKFPEPGMSYYNYRSPTDWQIRWNAYNPTAGWSRYANAPIQPNYNWSYFANAPVYTPVAQAPTSKPKQTQNTPQQLASLLGYSSYSPAGYQITPPASAPPAIIEQGGGVGASSPPASTNTWEPNYWNTTPEGYETGALVDPATGLPYNTPYNRMLNETAKGGQYNWNPMQNPYGLSPTNTYRMGQTGNPGAMNRWGSPFGSQGPYAYKMFGAGRRGMGSAISQVPGAIGASLQGSIDSYSNQLAALQAQQQQFESSGLTNTWNYKQLNLPRRIARMQELIAHYQQQQQTFNIMTGQGAPAPAGTSGANVSGMGSWRI